VTVLYTKVDSTQVRKSFTIFVALEIQVTIRVQALAGLPILPYRVQVDPVRASISQANRVTLMHLTGES
jgi:hypothetical protein